MWVAPIFLTLSCSTPTEEEAGEAVWVDKSVAISATRANDVTPDEGYEFFDDKDAIRLGIFADNGDSYDTYSDILTTDIYAQYNVVDGADPYWRYGYGREGTGELIAYKETSGIQPVLAACYPYRDALDLKHIPFELVDKQGLMWCEPVPITDLNRNNIELKFHHAMAKIHINVSFEYGEYIYYDDNTLKTSTYPRSPHILGLEACEGTTFVKKANYNATNGDFTFYPTKDLVVGPLSLNYYSTVLSPSGTTLIQSYSKEHDVVVYVVPELEFNGFNIRLAWEGGVTIDGVYKDYVYIDDDLTITEDHIQVADPEGKRETTLLPGYEYNFYVKLDNYLKVEKMRVDTDWVDKTKEPLSGDI